MRTVQEAVAYFRAESPTEESILLGALKAKAAEHDATITAYAKDSPDEISLSYRLGFVSALAGLVAGRYDLLIAVSMASIAQTPITVRILFDFISKRSLRVIFVDDHLDTGTESGRAFMKAFIETYQAL